MAIDRFGVKTNRKRTRTDMTKRPSKTASAGQSSRRSADRDVETDRPKKAEVEAARAKASKEASNAEEAEAEFVDVDESKPTEAEKAEAEAAEAVKTEVVDKKIEALDEEEGDDLEELRRKYMLRRFWHTASRFWNESKS